MWYNCITTRKQARRRAMEETHIIQNPVIGVYDHNNTKIIKCAGFIDFNNYSQLENTVENLIKSGSCSIIMDLEQVEFISSAGWGIFLGNMKKAEKGNGYIRLACMQNKIRDVFELLNLESLIQEYKTVEEALTNR